MVLSVCRRVLQDAHAAEDAFQATFLVLVHKAGAIRQPELLGSWLYGVASRTALRARAQAAQRVDHEMRTVVMSESDEPSDVERRELQGVLDEELSRLPSRLRDPLVLCYLQGKTLVEASGVLGCPPGSLSGRLAAAREQLRIRLRRRGVVTSAAFFAALLLESTARSEVPAALISATVRAATAAAASGGMVVGPSARAVGRAGWMLRGISNGFVKVLAAALLTAWRPRWRPVAWSSSATPGRRRMTHTPGRLTARGK